MKYYSVKNQYDEKIRVKLQNNLIEDREMMEGGKWSAALSPCGRKSFEPHYSVEIFGEDEYDGEALYRGQFFVEDDEYDTFIVDVLYLGGYCKTSMHNCYSSPLSGDKLLALALTVQEIEVVLEQIAQKHDKVLEIK